MQDIHRHIDLFSGQQHQRIQHLTDPLARHFGISYFCFQRVTNDGGWMIVANNPDWLHYSASQGFYNVDPSLVNPEQYQSGISFPAHHDDKDFQENLGKASIERFDLNHPLAICARGVGYCDFYFFAAPTKHHAMSSIYLNNLSTLKHDFVQHVQATFQSVLPAMQEAAIDLNTLLPHSFNRKHNILNIQLPSQAFLEEIHGHQLTSREIDCLQLIREGKTAKEIARCLGISYRTVEEYTSNLKRKLGVRQKRELSVG